jgi:hypothetical protein
MNGSTRTKSAVTALLLLLVPTLSWAASSRDNRADSTVFLGISPVGVHAPTLLTHPIGIGVYLGPNWMIGAEYGQFSHDFDDDETEATADYSNAGAYVRWFPGTNSFNVGLAVHKRILDGEATTTVSDPTYGNVDLKGTLKADATVGSLILGNQWMMDFGLVIGLDWIVVSGLLADSSKAEVTGTGRDADGNTVDVSDLDADTRRDAEKEMIELGNTANEISAFPGILVLTIGWSF